MCRRVLVAWTGLLLVLASCSASSGTPAPPSSSHRSMTPPATSTPVAPVTAHKRPPTTEVSGTDLVSPRLGVITTWGCAHANARCRAGLYVTEDLGHTWTPLISDYSGNPPPIDMPLTSPTFIDPQHGWVVGDDCAAGKAWLYRTATAGATWRRSPIPTPSCNAGAGQTPTFISPDQGWLTHLEPTGGAGTLSRSSDAGATWTKPGDLPTVGTVTFSDSLHGWLTESTYGNSGNIYRTFDGGAHWQRVHPSLPTCCTAWNATFISPSFSSPMDGVLPIELGSKHRRKVVFDTTSDGGATWSVTSAMPAPRLAGEGRYQATPASVGGPTDWWFAAGNPARIFVTTNAGATWLVHRAPRHLAVSSVDATGSGDAFLVGGHHRRAELFATQNGGKSWRSAMPTRRGGAKGSFVPFLHLGHPVSGLLAGSDGMLYGIEDLSPNGDAGGLIRIGPVTRSVTTGAPLTRPTGLVEAAGSLWTVAGGNDAWSLDRIDPASMGLTGQVPLSARPAAISSTPTGVWVATGSTLSLVDAATGSIVRTFTLANRIGQAAASPDGAVLYVTTRKKVEHDSNPLLEIDASTGAVLARSAAGVNELQGVGELTPTPTGVWVSFATGMMGALEFFSKDGLRTPAAVGNSGSNSLRTSLAGGELWLTRGDGSGYLCVDPVTGWSRGSVLLHHGHSGIYGGVAVVPAGAFTASGAAILLIHPPTGCPTT